MHSLVLVPGLGLDAAAWRPTLASLPGPARAHASVVTLPGYGRADDGRGLAPAGLAARCGDRLLARPSCVLVGHSASCQVVVHVAARNPQLVAGLVLLGPTTDPRAATWPRLAGRWLATARHEDPRQALTLVRQYTRTGVLTMRRTMEAARHDDLRTPLRDVRCPVLVVRGHHDRISPADWVEDLLLAAPARAGRSRAVTLPVGGHMLPLTHGPGVAALLDGFLSELPL